MDCGACQAVDAAHIWSSCLLFRRESQAGKSRKGASILGIQRTLIVHCRGLQTALPPWRAYCWTSHDAIMSDEFTEEQVLANKLVFQCVRQPVKLWQSICNQRCYQRWPYKRAMILCSHTFRMSVRGGQQLGTMPEHHVGWDT